MMISPPVPAQSMPITGKVILVFVGEVVRPRQRLQELIASNEKREEVRV